MIRNTTADMNDPLNAMLFLAEAMGPGGTSGAIEAQEKSGQTQLVNSDRLPTDTDGTDADFLAVGFTFGNPDPTDPMFRPATLPAGWSREATGHSMHSNIVDELGRKRVGIFYKAASYDRHADMRLTTVYGYVANRVYDGEPIISDGIWATPAAITAAAQVGIERARETVDLYSPRKGGEYADERLAKASADISTYEALVAQFSTEAGAL